MKTDHTEIRKRANRIFFRKLVLNIVLLGAASFFLSAVLSQTRANESRQRYETSASAVLGDIAESWQIRRDYADNITRIYHDGSQALLDDVSLLIERNRAFSVDDDSTQRQQMLDEMRKDAGCDLLFAFDDAGTILFDSASDAIDAKEIYDSGITEGLKEGTGGKVYGTEPVISRNTDADSADGWYFYSTECEKDGTRFMLGAAFNTIVHDGHILPLSSLDQTLERASRGTDSLLFAIDIDQQIFSSFTSDETDLIWEPISSAGLDEEVIKDGFAGERTILGEPYYMITKQLDEDTVICAAAKTSSVYSSDRYVCFWSVAGFVSVMAMCLLYTVIVRNDFIRNKSETTRKTIGNNPDNPRIFDVSVFRKVFPLMACGALLIGGISWYSQSLVEISRAIHDSENLLDELALRYESRTMENEDTVSFYRYRFENNVKLLADLLEADPSVLNEESDLYYFTFDKEGERTGITDDEGNPLKSTADSEWLQSLCSMNDIASLSVFNEDGRTIATDGNECFYTLSREADDPSAVFWDVLGGEKNVYTELPTASIEEQRLTYTAAEFFYYTTKDENGNTVYLSKYDYEHQPEDTLNAVTKHRSMIRAGIYQSVFSSLLPQNDLDSLLKTDQLGGGYVMLFDTEEPYECIYSPYPGQVGKSAEQLGITDKAFAGSTWYGFSRFNGEPCFEIFRFYELIEKYTVASIIPSSRMYHSRTPLALQTSLISLVLMLILCASATMTGRDEERLYEMINDPDQAEGLRSPIFDIILPSGRKTSTIEAAARWGSRRIKWRERSPEQKILWVVSAVFGLWILWLLIRISGAGDIPAEISVLRHIVDGHWEKGMNIFAFTAAAGVIMLAIIILTLLRIPVRLFGSLFGARGETVSHLILSFIRYGGTIGTLFYCLYLFGVDSQGLLASASILTLIIGLGAQSLVRDIIAGLFIVFEGEFRVGDIVTIDGYRGRVADIGLRTTKVMGFDGNVKIFANSAISGVLNMTKASSLASATISFEYGQDIAYVEEVLKHELPLLRAKNKNILDGPNYGGIKSLDESGVTISVSCHCEEKNVFGVSRYLNRELLNIFYKYRINIPYPHMVVTDERKPEQRPLEKDSEEESSSES